MKHWNDLIDYYASAGLPKKFLRHVCIPPSDARYLNRRVVATNPRNVLEIGTFIGLSTGIIAMSASPECRLVCVDLNLPAQAHLLVGSGNFKINNTTPTLTHVKRMLNHFQLPNPTILIAGFFSRRLNGSIMKKLISAYPESAGINIVGGKIAEQFDLIFIDGDHSEAGVASDLDLAHRYLTSKGEILLHDVSGDWSCGVNAGIGKFLDKHSDFYLAEIKSGVGRITKKG